MNWNNRALKYDDGSFTVVEAHYEDDNSLMGYTSPCLIGETVEELIATLERMVSDLKDNREPLIEKPEDREWLGD
jgi:hypothetical protein